MSLVWCGWRDSNPHSRRKRIFIPPRLSPPSIGLVPADVCSLDYPFAMAGEPDLGAARLVSTPSRIAAGLARDQHRPHRKPSPNLSSSAPGVSTGALKRISSPLRLPIPPHPHVQFVHMLLLLEEQCSACLISRGCVKATAASFSRTERGILRSDCTGAPEHSETQRDLQICCRKPRRSDAVERFCE